MLLCSGPEEMDQFGQQSESTSDEDQDDVLVRSLSACLIRMNLFCRRYFGLILALR